MRVREIQGMLAMHGLGSEEMGTEPTLVTMDWRTDSGGAAPPTPTRAERASFDVDVKPLPYRSVLAAWPDEWRERWGRRANDLEDAGLSWRDAEGRAFLEVWSDWRTCASVVERN
jgi:hypothetical protein